jgi:hypothetical protein
VNESPQRELTTAGLTPATLPAGVTQSLPRAAGAEPVEFHGFERIIDITKREVRLRATTNRNIVFVLTFDAIQNLADLTRGDDRWKEVG